MITGKAPFVFTAALAAALVSGGCATKKHVREAIAPVQQQVNTVQKQANDNKTAIGDWIVRSRQPMKRRPTPGNALVRLWMPPIRQIKLLIKPVNGLTLPIHPLNRLTQPRSRPVLVWIDSLQNLDNYKLMDTKQVFFRPGQYTWIRTLKPNSTMRYNPSGACTGT